VVFPFEEISLHWPRDQITAEAFMANAGKRQAFLKDKRAFASIAEESA